jgi:hypothetical protein
LIHVQAIFLHSVDDTFEGTGNKSLIPYQKLFSTYKQIIMTKLVAQGKDSDGEFGKMMTWYNSQVFDWFNSNDNSKGRGDNSGSSGIDEVMNQMEDLDINSDPGIELQLEDDRDGFGEDWNAEQVCLTITFNSMRCQSLFQPQGAHPKPTHQQSPGSADSSGWTLEAARWPPNSAVQPHDHC